MRNEFCQAVCRLSGRDDFVFLTGDLGFKALEPLRDAAGPRFINAGVAEQNMVSVAAGLARTGLHPWVYSIAPFAYARPFEQIRNDVCLHDLGIVIVGNGGGYGYGVMGATHHALEDYGALCTLQNLRAYVPAFNADVAPLVEALHALPHPAYLRLGLGEEPKGVELPPYAPWRKLLDGGGPALLVAGPLAGGIFDAARALDPARRPAMWVVSELPIADLPPAFLADVRRADHLLVAEEHVPTGGVGPAVAQRLLEAGAAPRRFAHRAARGYPSGLYGSQRFHRRECGLDPAAILAALATASPETP